jgi:replicative DNA helicase
MADFSYRQTLERNVLGTIIWEQKLFIRASAEIQVESFEDPRHAKIFEVCSFLADLSSEMDPGKIVLELGRRNELDSAGGADYVNGLGKDILGTEPRHLMKHIKALRQEISRVKYLTEQDRLRRFAADRNNSLAEVLSQTSTVVADIEYEDEGEELPHISKAIDQIYEELRSGIDPGTPSGFSSLDDVIRGGFKPGQLIVLAGQTGSGKSAMACLIALRAGEWAFKHDKGAVLIFSYEMSDKEITERMLIQTTPDLRDGYHYPHGFSERDKPAVQASLERMRDLLINIEDRSAEDVDGIKRAVQGYIQRTGKHPSLVVVDHVGLVGAKGANSDTEAVSRVTRGLKKMATRLEIPVLALAQFNRGAGNRDDDHTPRLSDLKQSSSIEQDANIVLLIDAPYIFMKNKEEMKRKVAEGAEVTLMVEKNRSGPRAYLDFEWIGPRVTFREKRIDPLLASTPTGSLNNAAGFHESSDAPLPEEPDFLATSDEIEEAVRALSQEPPSREFGVPVDDDGDGDLFG